MHKIVAQNQQHNQYNVQKEEEKETIQKLVLLFRDMVETETGTSTDSSSTKSTPLSTSTDINIVQEKPRKNSNNNNSTNNHSNNNDEKTSVNKKPVDRNRILAQYDEDDDVIVDYNNFDEDETRTDDIIGCSTTIGSNAKAQDYTLVVKPLQPKEPVQKQQTDLTFNKVSRTTTDKNTKQDIAKQAIKLVQEQARKNILKKKQMKLNKTFNDDSTSDDTSTGQWFVQEQVAEQKERKRLVQQAKKQFLLQEKEKKKKQIKTKASRKESTAATSTKSIKPKEAGGSNPLRQSLKQRHILSEEENRIAESARINQSTNSISNSLLDITNNDDDDDPDTKLELLAIAARQAVETYERKRNQHVPETKQDDDDDGSNDNKVASSVSILDNNKPKTIINKRNKSARINQSTNSISNSLLDITNNDDDDDPDTKLELLAIAARQAVETYERKRNQHVPETKQDDDDDGSNDNKVASSVSILDNIKPKTIVNKRNKRMKKYDDSLLFFMDPTNINFDIAQAAHNAVQAFEVSSK